MSNSPADRLAHWHITAKIVRAFYDVFDELTYGIPESAYHRAMRIALTDLSLQFDSEYELPVRFRGQTVGKYRADLVVEGKIIVEIKSVPRILDAHLRQLTGYLRISGLEVGLLVNFGPEPKFERVYNKKTN